MNKKQILEKLQAKNKNLRLPSGMEFSIEDKTLTIKMEKEGLIANMQTDAAAFEGWAICLKAWLPEYIEKVRVSGNSFSPSCKKEKEHYNRFLYRMKKFKEIYSWADYSGFEDDIMKFDKYHLVINVPNDDAEKKASHKEAQLERAFLVENKAFCDVIDHQLPVHLFDEEISEKQSVTPSSFLDIWSIKYNTLNIYELKQKTNKKVGIISELMFYVNVMVDVMKGEIKIPQSSSYRSFEKLFDFYNKKKCKYTNGYMLADVLHPLIEGRKSDILNIYLSNKNVRYYHKPIHEFKCLETEKQFKLTSNPIFESAKFGGPLQVGNGEKTKVYHIDYILDTNYNDFNLSPKIRTLVKKYFENFKIAWWGQNENEPTGHLLSSQIHCLNHLFALRKDKDAVLAIVNHATGMAFDEVLPSSLDDDGGYIAFEFAYKNDELLGENDKGARRGAFCTSIDAMIVARKGEEKWLIPIEWKYTENYEKEDKTNDTRLYRYGAKIVNSKRLKTPENGIAHSSYFQEPSYELMRQTLLCEQIVGHGYAKNFFHINIIPTKNTELRKAVETEFMPMLTKEAKFKMLDPQELLSPLKGNDKYKDLLSYLETRYWK